MIDQKNKDTINASNILRNGGKLLKDYCPNCKGLLFKYKEQIICFKCNSNKDIENIANNSKTDISIRIENIISKKIETLLNILENEDDIIKQMNLIELLSKYMRIQKESK